MSDSKLKPNMQPVIQKHFYTFRKAAKKCWAMKRFVHINAATSKQPLMILIRIKSNNAKPLAAPAFPGGK